MYATHVHLRMCKTFYKLIYHVSMVIFILTHFHACVYVASYTAYTNHIAIYMSHLT